MGVSNHLHKEKVKSSLLSIVVPVFNEEANIKELHKQLDQVLEKLAMDYEILFVNDGSSDRSVSLIKELNTVDEHVKLISFARNHGHQIAITAGLERAVGDAAITIDADLQHPPEFIPTLVEKWREGYEIVSMVKLTQERRGLIKSTLAAVFYALFSKISEIELDPHSSDFRLISRKALTVLNSMPEQQRFLRGLVRWIGFKHANIEYEAPARYAGQPKYSIGSLIRLAGFGIFSFSVFPLRASLYLGTLIAMLSFGYASYAVYARLFGVGSPPGYTDIVVAILFLGGLQLIFLGIIGEYLAKVYQEVRGRPLYIIDELVGL